MSSIRPADDAMCTKARVHIGVAGVCTCDRMGVRCGSGGGGLVWSPATTDATTQASLMNRRIYDGLKDPFFPFLSFFSFLFPLVLLFIQLHLNTSARDSVLRSEAWDVMRESER